MLGYCAGNCRADDYTDAAVLEYITLHTQNALTTGKNSP